MARISCFIDGFNLYHALNDNKSLPHFRQYKWLDLSKLCHTITSKNDTIANVFYFTAYAKWDEKKVKKHKTYVKALRSKKVQPVFGRFRKKERYCRQCKNTVTSVEEKQTDVNIAIKLFQEAMTDSYDTAIVLSGDMF